MTRRLPPRRLNRPRSRRRLDQGGVAPYPPAALLPRRGSMPWSATGIGFYGMVLLLAALFLALSPGISCRHGVTCFRSVPELHATAIASSTQTTCIRDARRGRELILACSRRDASHLLMALAITMKLSPAACAADPNMPPHGGDLLPSCSPVSCPAFHLGYLYIFTFHEQIKAISRHGRGGRACLPSRSCCVRRNATRFDREDDAVVVPFAMFLGIKMRVVPPADRALVPTRGPAQHRGRHRPGALRRGSGSSSIRITTVLLFAVLAHYLWRIGWPRCATMRGIRGLSAADVGNETAVNADGCDHRLLGRIPLAFLLTIVCRPASHRLAGLRPAGRGTSCSFSSPRWDDGRAYPVPGKRGLIRRDVALLLPADPPSVEMLETPPGNITIDAASAWPPARDTLRFLWRARRRDRHRDQHEAVAATAAC